MIGRVLLAALLAGVAAGLLMSVIQHVRITPLILEAEKYENAAPGHDHSATAETAPLAEEESWTPADGFERTVYTTISSLVTGAGFAALLAGVALISGLRLTARNGVIWGLCAFLAVSLAPSAGLPPELPGMPAGDLFARQFWWLATIAATGGALYLLAARREPWAVAAAVALIAVPHIIGAPQPETHESGVPAGLSAAFAANSLAANAVFWCLIGTFLGVALERFASDSVAQHAAA